MTAKPDPSDKTIIRVAKNRENPFVMLDKRMTENPNLSWKAKGLMSYMLSRPDGWVISVEDLIRRSTDGETAVRSGLQELEAAGHIVRRRMHRADGRFGGYELVVYEQPLPESFRSDPEERRHSADLADDRQQPLPFGDFPQMEKPHMENPHVENQEATNTNPINTNTTNTEREDAAPAKISVIPESAESAVDVSRLTDHASRPDMILAFVTQLYESRIGPLPGGYLYDELLEFTQEYPDPDTWKRTILAAADGYAARPRRIQNPWGWIKKTLSNGGISHDGHTNTPKRPAAGSPGRRHPAGKAKENEYERANRLAAAKLAGHE